MTQDEDELANAPKLLPCPHCGESEELYPAHHGMGEGKPYAIDCLGCGADFTPREGTDVIAAWNRRAALPGTVQPVAVAGLIEEYRNLVKTGAEYAASELRLAPTSAFEIYMGHFRDIGRDIEAALSLIPATMAGEGDVVEAIQAIERHIKASEHYDGYVNGISRNELIAWRAALANTRLPGEGSKFECASEGCGKPATVHFERGGVGSYYCHDCYMRIQSRPAKVQP